MILLLAALLGGASAGTLAVLPPGTPPDRVPVLRAALEELGWPQVTAVPAEDLVEAIDVVVVSGLPDPDECDGRVGIEAWRRSFERAREALQLLAFSDALAKLVALDIELVCLSSPPALSDLFRLELAVAEAHTFLVSSAGRDAGKRRFHEDEARAALTRAAAFGTALSVPPDLAPEVLAAYERARRRVDDAPPRVVVAGPGVRVGARFNGRPLPGGAFDAVRGSNLVQAADGAEVTAAARVRLTDGRAIVWLEPDGAPDGAPTLDASLDAAGRGAPDAVDEALLVALAAHLGEDVVYVRDGGTSVGALAAEGGRLVERGAVRVTAPGVDTWKGVVGAGPAVGWSNLRAGPLDGLGGLNAGFLLYGRVAVTPWLAVAASVDPWAVAAPIDASRGGGTLFRATIPATAGMRFGPHSRRFAVEGGVDVGVHAFGSFDEAGEAIPRASFLARGAVGLSGALGPRVALRAQGWFGAGLGYVAGGGAAGLEGRL